LCISGGFVRMVAFPALFKGTEFLKG